MKRRFFSVLVVALVALSSLEAGMELYIRPNFAVTYDTNVFSDPLPKYTQETGLLQRTGIGFYFDTDLFFAEGGRTGLSLSFLYSHPVDSHAWIIPGDSDNDNDTWVFTEEPSIFIAYGPMFRGRVGLVDLGIALRVSVGSINLFNDSMNLGLQAEPYVMMPLGSENWLLSAGFLFDAHFYDFLFHEPHEFYRNGYFMLTIGGYVGITYRWGIE